MDPAVTAAVIAVPTALLAAVAAYAGARAQARSAHRGPVDAVRRQHQRDAYAAFLAALQACHAATEYDTCYKRAEAEFEATGVPPALTLNEAIAYRTRELISTAPMAEVMRTMAVVDLEGPDHIAAAARITVGMARDLVIAAGWRNPAALDNRDDLVAWHRRTGTAIDGFVQAARTHLNDFG